jgi:predicted enzyme related to lactoylglutathione lyase
MAQPEHNYQMDYIEFPATDIPATKHFYSAAFGWSFTDYGPNYTSFHDGRLAGGFTMSAKPVRGGALVVLYAAALEETRHKVIAAGGTIVIEPFEFPGGRRFHFADPNGNELAVWSE